MIDLGKLGGSDAAALVGMSPYKRPIDIWNRVVNGVDIEQSPQMRRGIRLEPYARELYVEETGATLLGPRSCVFPGKPFLRANLDDVAEVDGQVRVVELKTASWRLSGRWSEGEVPEEYLLQTQWYMRATGIHNADLAVLFGVDDFRVTPIEADAELQEMLMEAACRFWVDYVEKKVPPPPDDSKSYSEFLREKFPHHNAAPPIQSTPEIDEWAARLRAAHRAFDKVSEEIELAENSIKALLREAEGVSGSWGKITLKRNRASTTTDWKGLCVELKPDPELVAKYTAQKQGNLVFKPTWAKEKS